MFHLDARPIAVVTHTGEHKHIGVVFLICSLVCVGDACVARSMNGEVEGPISDEGPSFGEWISKVWK